MGDLRAVIERVEKLDGPCPEVDGIIAKHFGEIPIDARWMTENIYGEPDAVWVSGGYGAYEFHDPERYTASLDAAIALCDRVLPGNYREITGPRKYLNIPTPVPGKFRAQLTTDAGIKSYRSIGWGETEAIALLLATLRALEAQGGGKK